MTEEARARALAETHEAVEANEVNAPAVLQSIYGERFDGQSEARNALWKVLCADFFQRWIPAGATVLEIAAGQCEFINNIRCGRKIAVDLNPDTALYAAPNVQVLITASSDLAAVPGGSVGAVFVSNFFEHISREEILATLREARRVLEPGGRILILQPNILYCAKDYWMFFDHITPVDDRALSEAMAIAGLEVEHVVRRFLPFTTKGRLPASPTLARLYLKIPLAWRILGQQSFLVGRKAGA